MYVLFLFYSLRKGKDEDDGQFLKERTGKVKVLEQDQQREGAANPDHSSYSQARPVVTIDYERYEHFLEDSDWSEDQKRQFIEALWSIIVSFVDLGFGVHPAQQACGQPDGDAPNTTGIAGNEVISSNTILVDQFKPATGLSKPVEAERKDYES